MVNEEKFMELYEIAKYDSTEAKKSKPMGEYYRRDYVWKELLISFFTGSIAFMLVLVIWGAGSVEGMAKLMNSMNVVPMAVTAVLAYVAFMLVYFIITIIVAEKRYTDGRKEIKKYVGHLKKVNKMYRRDEKLDMKEN